VFKTLRKGWGVRALKRIPKHCFVCEYVGELLTDEAADKRNSDIYYFQFDMCNNVDPFVVDARSYGNVARFISHSCEPNLSLQQVVVEEDEEKYFHLAFFSVREISPQEVSQNHSFCSSRLTSDTGTYD